MTESTFAGGVVIHKKSKLILNPQKYIDYLNTMFLKFNKVILTKTPSYYSQINTLLYLCIPCLPSMNKARISLKLIQILIINLMNQGTNRNSTLYLNLIEKI